jgi:hypothetical protein
VSNTHYGLIMFSGDPAGEHPDPELQGSAPSATFIAAGEAEFCWDALTQWTEHNPLRQWETAEVVARDPSVVRPSSLVEPGEP